MPSDFDNVATDPTEINVMTMLPQQYAAAGITFQRKTGAVQPCPDGGELPSVADNLREYGCTTQVVGSYLDSAEQIQVSVWVVPLPDAVKASGIYSTFMGSGNEYGWGAWCPKTGTGSQLCHEQWGDATYSGWLGHCHRYLARALALYVDLRSGSAAQTALDSAASAATTAVGANNIPIARC